MRAKKHIQHRDSIHRDTKLDPMSVALLDTAAMQRLGRVYQLGYAHLVYRGGTHTRLSHVLGAAHVATVIVDALRSNYEADIALPFSAVKPREFLPGTSKKNDDADRWQCLRYIARWAALLHDLGHIPLGHTLEDEFDRIFAKHDDFESPRMPFLWYVDPTGQDSDIRSVLMNTPLPECFGKASIGNEMVWKTVMVTVLHKERDGVAGLRQPFDDVLSDALKKVEDELKDVLDRRTEEADDTGMLDLETGKHLKDSEVALTKRREFIVMVRDAYDGVKGKTYFPYISDIVGNTICADYLDYLRRDAANVGLDVLNDDRVISSFYVAQVTTTDQRGETPVERKALRMALSLVDRRGKSRFDTCTGVVDLVRRRYRFAEIIYYHKTKVAASAMFAKAFALLKKVPEVREDLQRVVEHADIDLLIEELTNKTHDAFGGMRDSFLPTALLDPEIGDESLNLFLQHRAWREIRVAHKDRTFEGMRKPLRALAFLQGIVRRRLYKVCLSMNQDVFKMLMEGSKADEPAVDHEMAEMIRDLRSREGHREDIELKMAHAAGWAEDSVLLYVPPRKVQAKGIETYALDREGVVTLGRHSVVAPKALELSRDYQALWRLIVLVHPRYFGEHRALSDAVDELVRQLFPRRDVAQIAREMKEAAWFRYIPQPLRAASDRYVTLVAGDGASAVLTDADWRFFNEVPQTVAPDKMADSEEYAERAYLLREITESGPDSGSLNEAANKIRGRFGDAGKLKDEFGKRRTKSAAKGGDTNALAADRIALSAIGAMLKASVPETP
jgi:HD superfamily phosphohydrolase